METMLTEARLQRYVRTIRNTERWALSNWERIVAEPDLQGHYKGPCFWAALGNAEMAGRHRRLIEQRFLRDDGDFRTEEHVKGFLAFPCTTVNQYIYPNGWLTVGMQRMGAYDTARRGLAFLLRFQDTGQGGFYAAFDPAANRIDHRLLDSSSTSSAGLACLACGRLDEARRAGDFLLRLLELQPDGERRFFSCMRPDGALHTDVFGTEDEWDPESRKQKCLSAEHDGTKELTWLIGKPTRFLTKLYAATGASRYLDGARAAFDFFHRLDTGAWTNYASCKTMWAGAELYRITGEARFAETAMRLLDFYCETQADSGAWVHTLWYRDESEQAFTWTADITFEYGAEFSDVVYELCAGSKP